MASLLPHPERDVPAAPPGPLGRKQASRNGHFVWVAQHIEDYVSAAHCAKLVEQATAAIKTATAGKRAAVAWSGGKDSIALLEVCRLAGLERCCFGMTNLEYPAFLAWVTEHMPAELEVVCTGQDLKWLATHPEMLFPQDSATAAKWFQQVQHAAQEFYYQKHDLDVLVLGRRRADGNFVGRAGSNVYRSRGVTRYSPLADWTHEEVIGVCHYAELACPPIYGWSTA